MLATDNFIDALQERNGFQIFATAKRIRYPFARRPAVIAIQHRCDRIHAQTINAKLFNPIQRAAREKIANLVAAEIVDKRVPVAMEPLACVGVFVQGGAVELCKSVRVARKMRGHPIEQHTEPHCVARRHKSRKSCRWPEARGDRIHTERLITP